MPRGRATLVGALGLAAVGCADKAPEPKWPEPPPPTLAEPIGGDESPEQTPAAADASSEAPASGATGNGTEQPADGGTEPAPQRNDPDDGAVRLDR